jgi:hypothetical protein
MVAARAARACVWHNASRAVFWCGGGGGGGAGRARTACRDGLVLVSQMKCVVCAAGRVCCGWVLVRAQQAADCCRCVAAAFCTSCSSPATAAAAGGGVQSAWRAIGCVARVGRTAARAACTACPLFLPCSRANATWRACALDCARMQACLQPSHPSERASERARERASKREIVVCCAARACVACDTDTGTGRTALHQHCAGAGRACGV